MGNYKEILDNYTQAITCLDYSGNIVYKNLEAEKLLQTIEKKFKITNLSFLGDLSRIPIKAVVNVSLVSPCRKYEKFLKCVILKKEEYYLVTFYQFDELKDDYYNAIKSYNAGLKHHFNNINMVLLGRLSRIEAQSMQNIRSLKEIRKMRDVVKKMTKLLKSTDNFTRDNIELEHYSDGQAIIKLNIESGD